MSQYPPQVTPGGYQARGMRPHRGVLILVFGILSVFLSCFILGIVSWVMGNSDLREMDAELMDPSGRGLTQAGKILGIVSCGLAALGIIIGLLLLALGVIGAAAAGAAGAGGP